MLTIKDYQAEMKALQDRQRELKRRHVLQLGELVVATGADTLDPTILAGVLLGGVTNDDMVQKEEWRKAGARFLEGRTRPRREAGTGARSTPARGAGQQSAGAQTSAD